LSDIRDVVIVGSGPAGLTAAIYTARANLAPLLVEGEPSSTGDQPGGQLMLTSDVENYPGFVDGIMGPELMTTFRAQAARFGAEIITSKVSRVDLTTRPFSVWTDEGVSGAVVQTHSLIVATGARALMLGLPAEQQLLGRGVSTCATCDGFFFRERAVGVVGGGDSAIEEALFLTKFATSVTVIHRRKELRASKIMQDRAFRNPKIHFRWDSVVTEILGDGSVKGVRLRDVSTGEESTLDIGGLFVAIGHAPNTDLFRGQLAMDKNGYITTHDGTKTSVEGVFACGDVQDSVYRQAVTAAGSGCMAAIDAERWLEATKHAAEVASQS
jgi:thioredoxin reductase (NADPH)